MVPEDEVKTAFKTHHGLFQFCVMPFGLATAPGTFQCVMNSVMADGLRKFVLVFMDDILIYIKYLADHIVDITHVLQALRKAQLYVKMSKCAFSRQSIEYLGHIIS